jgi:cephalosporin-C deacetylase-like acetyl esterase/pimeloyl-ACP methyl ester carboxylesterase
MVRKLLALAVVLAVAGVARAEDLRVLPEKIDGVAPKAMMHEYLVGKAREALDRRQVQYEKIKTPEQAKGYQERLRQFFVAQLGGFPERTPLEPRVVGTVRRDGYRVEKIIFQSQPRHYVTAALYLPDAKPPYPGVLVPCGHSDNGKAMDTYQRACILLAKNGMAALCYDPIDQGERFQLLDARGKPLAGGTTAHCLVGVGSALLGRNAATFRVWDGMRAIDYLETRPEIDSQRIGCTGNSGGGTLTSYLMALDPRIRVAAPSCYLTSLRRLVETIGPQDAEQNVHAQIAFGMDHADYVHMRAPRPTLMCVATRDYFDINGAWDSFRQAKRFYTRLGFAERMDLIENDAQHGFSPVLRTGATRWMRRWLLGADDAITETESPVLPDKELQCTPEGQVMRLAGARSVYDLNLDLEKQLAKARARFWKEKGTPAALEEVRRVTGIRPPYGVADLKWERVGSIERKGYRIDKLVLRPEPGIWLPALAFVPQEPSAKATLYLHAAGKETWAGPGGPIENVVAQGHVVLAVDLRGLGETQPGGKSDGIAAYLAPEWTDAFLAYMLDTSYLAMRTKDILYCAEFLARYESGAKPREVHLFSVGGTGPAALHAAALAPERFASVTLTKSLRSWSDVVRTPQARNQWINVVHGALRVYDLPDLLATLPKEKVKVIDPLDAMERPVEAP